MGFQLSSLGVEDDLELLRSGAERVGAEGLAIDALALRGRWHIDRERGHGALGVVRARLDWEVRHADVLHLDRDLLLLSANKGLDGAQLPVLAVSLDREGGVVRAEPEVDVGMDGTSFTAKRNLHTVLRGVGELPGLSGLALDSLNQAAIRADLRHAPAGHLHVCARFRAVPDRTAHGRAHHGEHRDVRPGPRGGALLYVLDVLRLHFDKGRLHRRRLRHVLDVAAGIERLWNLYGRLDVRHR